MLDHSAGSEVYIYDADRPTDVLGGLILADGLTNGNFYLMIEILFIFESPFSLRHQGSSTIQKDEDPLQTDIYYTDTAPWFHVFYFFIAQQLRNFKQAPLWKEMMSLS